jgi:hypothetical protein
VFELITGLEPELSDLGATREAEIISPGHRDDEEIRGIIF